MFILKLSRGSLSALLLGLIVCLARPGHCQSLVTSRAALPGSDTVDWAVLGNNAYPLSNPFTLLSAQGLSVTVSQTGHGLGSQYGGVMGTVQQAGVPLAEGTLNGNFAPGDIVLDALDGGTVSLAFPHGVYGGGAQIAAPTLTASGAGVFTVQIQAFGRDNARLASFTRSGTFSAKGDNSALFLGITDAAPDIYRISYTGTTLHRSLFLNRFDIAVQAAPMVGHTHVLWNNPDGKVMLWNVAQDGSHTLNTFGPYDDGSPNTPWRAAALATGPDGLSHILWTDPDGRVILWTVSDAGDYSYAVYGPYSDPYSSPATVVNQPSTPWSAVSLSVGPDNVTHILWTNPDGRVVLWNVDSAFHFTSAVFGPYTDGAPNTPWNATAIATGPDNVTRLAWNNPDGRVILWNIDHGFNFAYQVYGPYTDGSPTTPWGAAAVSVGPDNVTHLLWTNPDTRVILWNLDSAGGFTYGVYGPYNDGSPNTPWGAAALTTGPDGLSHLLWTNPDNRVILWNVDSVFHFTYSLYGPLTDGAQQNIWSAAAISAGP